MFVMFVMLGLTPVARIAPRLISVTKIFVPPPPLTLEADVKPGLLNVKMSSALPPVAVTLPVPLKVASIFPVAALASKLCRLAIFSAVPTIVRF